MYIHKHKVFMSMLIIVSVNVLSHMYWPSCVHYQGIWWNFFYYIDFFLLCFQNFELHWWFISCSLMSGEGLKWCYNLCPIWLLSLEDWLWVCEWYHFQQYFSYIVAIRFIGWANWWTQRKTTNKPQVANPLYHIKFYKVHIRLTRVRNQTDNFIGDSKGLHW